MKKRYRLELDVVIDDVEECKAIQIARERCRDTGSAEQGVGKRRRRRTIPPEEFVGDLRGALMELVKANDLLGKAGIQLAGIACTELEADTMAPTEGDRAVSPPAIEAGGEEGPPGEVDLDEFETGMYLCRWPNGEFSLVLAATRRDALVQLDEWAPGHASQLFAMESCMVDFRLTDEGEIDLSELGEDTADFIWATAYPALDKVRGKPGVMHLDGEYTRKGKEVIRKAVEHERKRLWEKQPVDALAETETGRNLQKELGMAGPVADLYIQEGAKRILESDPSKKGKPN